MKKILKLSLAAFTIVALLTGCGGASKENSQTTDNNNGAGKEDIVITAMAVGSEVETYPELYQEIADEFSANNEWGAKVNFEFYENEQYKTKLTTLMAANSVPDMFFAWELDYLRPFVEGGKVYPIGEILDQDEEWKDSFAEGALEPLTYDGQVYAIPSQKSFTVMFYNKQLFEENGVEIPTTYEEFLNVCETLKNNGVTPMILSATDSWIPAQFLQQLSNGIAGMDLYEGIANGERKWNDEAHIEAANEVQMMIDKGYFQNGMLGMATEEVQSQFKQGKAAMYFMGAWDAGVLIDQETSDIADVVGAFTLPAKNPEFNNISVGSVETNFAISETSEHKEIAAAFLKYFTSRESQLRVLYDEGRIPSTKVEFDESKLKPLTSEIIELSNQSAGLTPWWDRVFGAGEGVEFNNKALAIFGGEDPQKTFDELQDFAEMNANR